MSGRDQWSVLRKGWDWRLASDSYHWLQSRFRWHQLGDWGGDALAEMEVVSQGGSIQLQQRHEHCGLTNRTCVACHALGREQRPSKLCKGLLDEVSHAFHKFLMHCGHAPPSTMCAVSSLPLSARPPPSSTMYVPCKVPLWMPGVRVLLRQRRKYRLPATEVPGHC